MKKKPDKCLKKLHKIAKNRTPNLLPENRVHGIQTSGDKVWKKSSGLRKLMFNVLKSESSRIGMLRNRKRKNQKELAYRLVHNTSSEQIKDFNGFREEEDDKPLKKKSSCAEEQTK